MELLILALASTLWALYHGESINSFLLNMGAGFFGAIITYLIFDSVIKQKEKEDEENISLMQNVHSLDKFIRELSIKKIIQNNLQLNQIIDNSNFDGIILRGLNFIKIKFYYVSFFGTDLSKVKMSNCLFIDCNIQGSNLTEIVVNDSNFSKSNLCNAFLSNSNINNSIFIDVNLENTDLTKANFRSCNMKGINLTNAKVNGSKFFDTANLTGEQVVYLKENGAIVL